MNIKDRFYLQKKSSHMFLGQALKQNLLLYLPIFYQMNTLKKLFFTYILIILIFNVLPIKKNKFDKFYIKMEKFNLIMHIIYYDNDIRLVLSWSWGNILISVKFISLFSSQTPFWQCFIMISKRVIMTRSWNVVFCSFLL